MADTFTWSIANLERHLSDGTVTTVHWTVNAERIVDGTTYSTSSYGSVGLAAPDPNDFILYEDLTPTVALEWTQNQLGAEKVTEIEAGLSARLDEIETPVNASGVPW